LQLLCHVCHLVPNINVYVNQRALVGCQRDTIARPRVELDYLMLKFLFDLQDESRKIGVVLEGSAQETEIYVR
jgi:hypothetical protein